MKLMHNVIQDVIKKIRNVVECNLRNVEESALANLGSVTELVRVLIS